MRHYKCIGAFRVDFNEHDAISTNRSQAKNSTHQPSYNHIENNEQSDVATNKQTVQTSSKRDDDINNSSANEDTSTTPLEFDINDNLTHRHKVKLNNLLNKYRNVFFKTLT